MVKIRSQYSWSFFASLNIPHYFFINQKHFMHKTSVICEKQKYSIILIPSSDELPLSDKDFILSPNQQFLLTVIYFSDLPSNFQAHIFLFSIYNSQHSMSDQDQEQEDIFIIIYDEQTKKYEITEESMEFPDPNTVKNTIDCVTKIFKRNAQILRSNNKPVLNMDSKIQKYIAKKDNKSYITIRFLSPAPHHQEFQKYLTVFLRPCSKFENKHQMLSLNPAWKYKQLQQHFSSIINKQIKFVNFNIPSSDIQIKVQTPKSNQKLIPLCEEDTLSKICMAEEFIIKIEVQIVSSVKVSYLTEYSLSIPVNTTIKGVLSILSEKQLTFTSQNFMAKLIKQEKNSILGIQSEIFQIYEGKTIQIVLVRKTSFQFLAFNEPIQESSLRLIDENLLMSFVFWYNKDKNLLNFIQKDEKKFEIQWRKLTLDCFKRGISGRTTMILDNMEDKLAKKINNFTLWRNQTLNDSFINYYFIERCNSFAKLLLCDMLKDNFALPTHIMSSQKKTPSLIEQNIFLTTPGVTLVSIGLSPPEIMSKCSGKSSLLNEMFYTQFSINQNRHPTLNLIPEVKFQIFKNVFPLNIIDIPRAMDVENEKKLLKGANIILLNSWQSKEKTGQRANQLAKTYKCYVLILYRDRNQPTTNAQFSYDLQKQHLNGLQVHNLKQNKGATLIINILRQLIGTYILQVSKRITQKEHQKIFSIYEETKYIKKFQSFTTIMENMRKNITSLQTDKNKPLNGHFINVLKFIYSLDTLEQQKKFIYIFINCLKKMKSYAEKPYLGLYTIKAEIGKNYENVKKDGGTEEEKQKYEKYKKLITQADMELKKIFNESVISEKLMPKQNIQNLNKKITVLEKQIIPKIFSSQIAMRQLLQAQELVKFDIERNLKDVYVFLNKLEIQRGAPFQIIDGDNLEMPLQSIKKSLDNISGKVCVISILGPQSSGKSTVLNFLFGCNFKASQGRCTKGVYGSYYEVNNSQCSLGYNGLLIIDTEGINSQSKSKEFDRQLVSFIMSISDILIITMKGDLDKAVGELLVFCLQNSRKRFENFDMKIMLVLNQNNTNDITLNNQEINEFKSKIDINHQIQLSRAFSTLSINSTHLPFLHQKINFIKFTPLSSFMDQIIQLQKHIVQTLNQKFNRQFLTIHQKMENFAKNWEIVKSFSQIYKYASNEQIKLVNGMDQWILEKTKTLQKFHETKLLEFRNNSPKDKVQLQEDQQRSKIKKQCVEKMEEMSKNIIDSLNLAGDKVKKIKLIELKEFIKDELIKKYNAILDEYKNIFDKKINRIEEERVITYVKNQGIKQILNRAHDLNRSQCKASKQLGKKQMEDQFYKIWKDTLAKIQQKLNNYQSFPVIFNLMSKEYYIEMKKFEPKQQDQTDNYHNKINTLPSFNQEESHSIENVIDQKQKFLSLIKAFLQSRKNTLIERSNKDPIFIYGRNIGKVTASKTYLNIENSYLSEQMRRKLITVQKSFLSRLFSAQMQKQLKYKIAMDKINKELSCLGLLVIDPINLQKVLQSEKGIFPLNKPLLKMQFKDASQNQGAGIDYKYIKLGNIGKIKRNNQRQIRGNEILQIDKLISMIQSEQIISDIYENINKQLSQIGINITKKYDGHLSLQNKYIEYKTKEQFQNKIRSLPFFGRKVEQGVTYQQNIKKADNIVIGFYEHLSFTVKLTNQNLRKYFSIYISDNYQLKIKTIKNESLNVVCENIDFISKILTNIAAQYEKISKQPTEKRKEKLVNQIFQQFRKFDQDFRQLSLQATSVFKGYCHLYAVYLLVSDRMIKQNNQKMSIINEFKALQKSQMDQFKNRASPSQERNSKQAYFSMQKEVMQNFKQQIKSKLGKLKENLVNFEIKKQMEKQFLNVEQIMKLGWNSLEGLKQQNETQKKTKHEEVVKYLTDKYEKLEQIKEKVLKQKKNSFATTINAYLLSFQSEKNVLRASITKFEEIKNNLRLSVNDIDKYDQKAFFQFQKQNQTSTARRLYTYFIKVIELVNNQKQLEAYENQQKIKKEVRLHISAQIFFSQSQLHEFNILIKRLENSNASEISNLYYFLVNDKEKQQNEEIFWKEMNNFYQGQKKKLQQELITLYQQSINFDFCAIKSKCPCCNQICFKQGTHPIHEANYHQVRGWGGTAVALNNKIDSNSYLSTLVCEDLNEKDRMLINNKIYTWESYKYQQKQFWKLPEKTNNPTLSIQQKALWNKYGEHYAKKINIKFRKYQQVLKYHLIFIIDESGSMHNQWHKVQELYKSFVQKIKNSTDKNSLDVDNTLLSAILFSTTPRQLYRCTKPKFISQLPNMVGQNTYYIPAFENLKNILSTSLKQYSTTVFFLTDGEAMDGIAQITQYKRILDKLIEDYRINFVPIYFSHNYQQNTTTFFQSIFSNNLRMAKDVSGIDEIIRTEVEILVSK